MLFLWLYAKLFSHLFAKRCCQKLLRDTSYLYLTLLLQSHPPQIRGEPQSGIGVFEVFYKKATSLKLFVKSFTKNFWEILRISIRLCFALV